MSVARSLAALFAALGGSDRHGHAEAAIPAATERAADGLVACGWIWESNARAFCDSLAAEVGYDFDDSDWQAIETALPGTDDDQPPSSWYVYPFVGRDRVDLRVAQGVGGAEISVRIEGAVGTRTRHRIAAVLDLMSQYRITTE
ncbi:hypothetical protein ACHZ98_22000 [Streptomyces sp. MAR4 CNY-716]